MAYPIKLSKDYPHPANLGFCKLTGCKVTSPPEWRVVEPDYACGVGLMNQQIIFSLPWGRGSETGIRAYLKIMNEIFDNHLGPADGVVIIDDFSLYHGISQRGRKAYIDGLKNRPEVKGLVCYNLSPYFRFNLGIGRRLHIVPYPIEFVANYEEAILCAARILKAPIGRVDPTKPIPTAVLEPLPATRFPLLGQHAAGGMRVDYRKVEDDVTLLQVRGSATSEGVDAVIQNQVTNLRPTWGITQLEYVIVEIEDMGSFPMEAIGHYAKRLAVDPIHTETRLIVLVGDEAFTTASNRFTRMHIPIQVVEAKTLDEAMTIIECHREGSAVPIDLDLPAPDEITNQKTLCTALIDVLSHTRWDIEGTFKVAELYPPEHELRLLLDALDTIKTDVDMMLADQRRQLADLASAADAIEESEQQFRALFDVAADGILVIDEAGAIIDSNPAAAAMFRSSADGLNGSQALEFLPAIESFMSSATNPLNCRAGSSSGWP